MNIYAFYKRRKFTMAILTASEILKQMEEGHIKIGNFNPDMLQPNSYDLTLGNQISYYALMEYGYKFGQVDKNTPFESYGMTTVLSDDDKDCGFIRGLPMLDSREENMMIQQEIPEEGYVLLPRILYLAFVNESVWSDKFVSEVSAPSSIARLGISLHKTSGYANLGHHFKWVLEIEVTHPIRIYPNMKFAQMVFHTVYGDTSMQYNGKYQGIQLGDRVVGSLQYKEK